MSLVGSLEDLGLGEILQIVSLSGKSGVLWIRSRHGEGHVVFSRGLIRGAFLKDGARDLAALVAAAGVLPADQLQALERAAQEADAPLEALLCARTSLDAGCIDELRGRHVEETVLRMFGWLSGEFSFEIRDEPRGSDIAEELLLRTGLNAQFLALEGTRLRDEGGDAEPEIGGAAVDDETSFADVACDGDEPADVVELTADDELEAEALPAADADDAPLAALAEPAPAPAVAPIEAELLDEAEPALVDPPGVAGAGGGAPAELQITVLELVDREVDRAELPAVLPEGAGAPGAHDEDDTTLGAGSSGALAPPRRASLPSFGAGPVPVIVTDRELVVLEWVKRALAPLPVRVHIFQRSEQAIARIRQYVARGELPLVLLTTGTPPDPVSGARDWAQIAARLRAQVPNLPLVLLAAQDASVAPANERAIPDALAARPDMTTLSDERARERRETLAAELRGALERARSKAAPRSEPATAPSAGPGEALRGLREVSARLRDPSSRGDVLRLVLDYAARTFDRVAIFAVRDGEAFGVAQRGLPDAGGPDDVDLRRIHFPADEIAWLRKVLEARAPVRARPGEDGDRDLASRLGHAAPAEVYVAPIESGERIAAALYADNLTTRRALGDTSALEVVLHEAGLALERAVLERALEQAEGERVASAEPDPF